MRTQEQVREYGRAWARDRYATDPEYRERKKAASKARRDAGLTKRYETSEDRLKYRYRAAGVDVAQAGPKPENCEVCGMTGVICLDHAHNSKRFRGWLCRHCNTAIGHAKDNPNVLRALAKYLERSA